MVVAILAMSLVAIPVQAISEAQENAIVEHCSAIRSSLKDLQRADSRTRVYLGSYYDEILTNFITPLNMRLVENNLSNADFNPPCILIPLSYIFFNIFAKVASFPFIPVMISLIASTAVMLSFIEFS